MRSRAWFALALSMLVWAPGAATGATPDYYPLPTGHTIAGGGVTADGAGNIWFGLRPRPRSGQPTPSLVRLIPAQASPGTSNGLGLPDARPGRHRLLRQPAAQRHVQPQGWQALLRSQRRHRRLGTSGVADPGQDHRVLLLMLPGHQDLWDIAPSPAGGAWFTEHSAEQRLAHLLRRSHCLLQRSARSKGPNIAIQNGNTSLNSQRYSAQPAGIAVGRGRTAVVCRGESRHSGLPGRELQRQRRQLRRVPDLAV